MPTARTSWSAWYLLALATLVFACLGQAGSALAGGSIPCDPEPTDMPILYSDAVSCSIDPPGDVDIFRFLGTAGDVVTVRASRVGGGNPCVELFDPGGGQVDDICGASVAGIDATLGQTGLYSILASENGSSGGNQVMDYTLSYQCIVGACIDIFIFADGFESGDTTAWSGSVP